MAHPCERVRPGFTFSLWLTWAKARPSIHRLPRISAWIKRFMNRSAPGQAGAGDVRVAGTERRPDLPAYRLTCASPIKTYLQSGHSSKKGGARSRTQDCWVLSRGNDNRIGTNDPRVTSATSIRQRKTPQFAAFFVCSGGWIRTTGLRVMSPTSCHCSTPHRSATSTDKNAPNFLAHCEIYHTGRATSRVLGLLECTCASISVCAGDTCTPAETAGAGQHAHLPWALART